MRYNPGDESRKAGWVKTFPFIFWFVLVVEDNC